MQMDKNSNKSRIFLICLTLASVTFAVYYDVRSFGFVNFDDPEYISGNPNIQAGITLKSIEWALTADYAANWHPLTWLSHMLDCQLFGLNPAGHHIVNLIFHIANTLLLFLILKRMTGALWQSAFVAALFALHPLHVESVVWITERKDVLSTFFWLLTMAAYLRYVKKPNIARYLPALMLFALGLMAKPMLVTLPFVLLLLDYWPLGRIGRFNWRVFYRLILEKIPFIFLSAASSVITFLAQRSSEATVSLALFPLKSRILNAVISYSGYIEKMFFPARLAFFYPNQGPNISVFYAVISAVFLLAVTILIFRFAANHRYLVTGWFWYIGTLVPVIGVVQVGSQVMADRYSYITLTGLFIIIAWGLPELLAKWPYRKIAISFASLAVLFALTVCTYFQTRYWKDSISLFQHALQVTKDNLPANLGITPMLLEQGRFEEAIWHYSQALRINPDSVEALSGLGVTLCRVGRVDESFVYYERALRLQPQNAIVHSNLGVALYTHGKYDEAIAHFKQALEIDPNYTDARNNLIRAEKRIDQKNPQKTD
jgi:protein O-mannosyl-transferase